MTEGRLRAGVAVFLIASHAVIPVLIFVMYLLGGFTRDELTQLLQIVVPMVTAFSALGIGYVISVKESEAARAKGAQLSRLFVTVTISFTTLFVVLLTTLILLKAFNAGLQSFRDLEMALATTETVFGAVTGRLLATLFKEGGTT